MCVYSMMADHYIDKWRPGQPLPIWDPPQTVPGPTKEQMEKLIKLLEAAKEMDKAAGEPDCELEDKKRILRELAEKLGVDPKQI